jgi:SP family sugar:H+ symporter-like MFS transporter
MRYFIHQFTGMDYPATDASTAATDVFIIPAWRKSLIVPILSAGTFTGAVLAGDLADWYGRRTTIMAGCAVFQSVLRCKSLLLLIDYLLQAA